MFWLSLAAAGAVTAAGLPAHHLWQVLSASNAAAESGSLLLLATGLFGAATVLGRRRPE